MKKETIDTDILWTLNAAFAADPRAMRTIIINRVPCTNSVLADHPTICVEPDNPEAKTPEEAGGFYLGFLGLLNGVLEGAGLSPVDLHWSEPDANKRHRLLGFKQKAPCPDAKKTTTNTICVAKDTNVKNLEKYANHLLPSLNQRSDYGKTNYNIKSPPGQLHELWINFENSVDLDRAYNYFKGYFHAYVDHIEKQPEVNMSPKQLDFLNSLGSMSSVPLDYVKSKLESSDLEWNEDKGIYEKPTPTNNLDMVALEFL